MESPTANFQVHAESPVHAMTLDVEDYFHVAAFNKVIGPDSWDQFELRVERNTEAFMELLDERDVRATFFILGWVADKVPHLIKRIAEHGHEIASHGYSHQLIYRQTPAEFLAETDRSKKLLEDIVQQPIRGYRAASYSITKDSLWALNIIAEQGFEYDSSIYPIRHDNYGLLGGPETPYRIKLNNGAELLEFPITTAKLGKLTLPVGGGGYFCLYPYWVTQKLLNRRLAETQAPFVFYLHPWELDPEQPKVAGAGALSRFRHYNNLHRVRDRLRLLLRDYGFTSMYNSLEQLPKSNLAVYSYT